MMNTLTGFLAGEETEPIWKSVPALVRAVNDLQELLDEIVAAGEAQNGRVGPAADRKRALQLLGDEAHVIASAIHACAVDAGNEALATRMDLSRSDVTKGSNTSVVARCRDILNAATENAETLKDYDVASADINSLKKRVDAFDGVKSKPREKIATSSAATKRLPKFFRQANAVLTRRLDKLAVKLSASHPKFYEEYRAARNIVGNGRSASKGARVIPAPTTTPVSEAA